MIPGKSQDTIKSIHDGLIDDKYSVFWCENGHLVHNDLLDVSDCN